MINVLIIALVFGYSGWMIYRHVQKGKEGACAGCDKGKSCSAASLDSPFSCSGKAADSKH
ncbi:FeoB-associated Cys-rich membrane protein [Paenibacillus sp. 19GGS1-52]|uniref:FeoB-associated Cys-rich membrane protein n=1 Tax=Paenibacillus sp. 19GGS1-52 TaxID=2758563 RepID=UPI001EFA70E1|nr:FeoB-associated Cys-rich membrane protein [Paenibacillus sp. 19GGS1-52]ULO06342.1 FeoB-associated Cys-rich membrane protein [Paenibacillus sp. 19GGS1-52]